MNPLKIVKLFQLALFGYPYLVLGHRIYGRLKKSERREELINILLSALEDEKISQVEWKQIGDALGVFVEGKEGS